MAGSGGVEHGRGPDCAVEHPVSKRLPGEGAGYLTTVRDQVLESFGHYAELLLSLDDLIHQ